MVEASVQRRGRSRSGRSCLLLQCRCMHLNLKASDAAHHARCVPCVREVQVRAVQEAAGPAAARLVLSGTTIATPDIICEQVFAGTEL
jgi:hypothetical protein